MDERQLFRGGALFDGSAAPRTGFGVLVSGGKVEQVAPLAEFDGYSGKIVETDGGTLMPGLIDCHAHVFLSGESDTYSVMHQRDTARIVLATTINAVNDLAGARLLRH